MKKEKEWGIFSQEEKNLTDNWQNNVLRSTYEPPKTCLFKVETEGNFCGSILEPGDTGTQDGFTIQEHGFANPGTAEKPNNWELDLSDNTWDN